MQKVKNAATHLKEGAADAVNTVKHGGKNQKEGENDERVVHGEQHFGEEKTNTQAAKDTMKDAKDNAKAAGKGEKGPATGHEYNNATHGPQTDTSGHSGVAPGHQSTDGTHNSTHTAAGHTGTYADGTSGHGVASEAIHHDGHFDEHGAGTHGHGTPGHGVAPADSVSRPGVHAGVPVQVSGEGAVHKPLGEGHVGRHSGEHAPTVGGLGDATQSDKRD